MTMTMTDHKTVQPDIAIDNLVDDLAPVKRFSNHKLWAVLAILLPAVGSLILLSQGGFRPDIIQAVMNGTLIWKTGIFVLLFMGSLLAVQGYARPVIARSRIGMLLLWVGLFAAISEGIIQWVLADESRYRFLTYPLDNIYYAMGCFASIIVGGGIVYGALWMTWLRDSASPFPVRLGFAAGALSGSLATIIYSLHCPHDNALYVFIYYGGSIGIMALIGSLYARRFLKW